MLLIFTTINNMNKLQKELLTWKDTKKRNKRLNKVLQMKAKHNNTKLYNH